MSGPWEAKRDGSSCFGCDNYRQFPAPPGVPPWRDCALERGRVGPCDHHTVLRAKHGTSAAAPENRRPPNPSLPVSPGKPTP